MNSLNRSRRVDWSRVVMEIMDTGMTRRQIAQAVGCSVGAVKVYRYGQMDTEPAFWVGAVLLRLWSNRCGLPPEQVPLKAVGPSVSQVLRELA